MPLDQSVLRGSTEARDLARERAVTDDAALPRLVAIAGRLSDFAEQRAGDGPVVDAEDRDFALEVLEELADARNYLVWWIDRFAAADGAAASARAALAAVVVAYSAVLDAQQLGRAPARPVRPALADAIAATGMRWPSCRCRLEPAMTNGELVALGAGCSGPRWCCPRLDAVRRRLVHAIAGRSIDVAGERAA